MKLFTCERCGQLVYFENGFCERCGSALGFLPDRLVLGTLAPQGDGRFAALAESGPLWQPCGNAEAAGCNWMVPAGDAEGFCLACRLNRTIPDLSVPGNAGRWRAIEAAKRRLIYALMRFGLPLARMEDATPRGLAFDFLADTPHGDEVMTGHADGLVTVNIAEADPAEREQRRTALGEPYRTLLGHLRHEVGHYYWDLLVRDGGRLEAARALFGDERADYAAALEAHYRDGPPPDWQQRFVSAYAASHPWEDFAETWTHFLHIVDTLDTAASFGLAVEPQAGTDAGLGARIDFDPYRAPETQRLIAAWLPLTYVVNSLSRSMGQPDLYPFVLSPPAIEKLGFIQALVRDGAA